MSRSTRRFAIVLTAVGALTLAQPTRAAEPTAEDKALATTLFKEAKDLLAAGKVAEACRKLEESERLNPAAGTLLNLAVCHEKEGRTATAWAEFREARIQAQRDKRDDRITLADEHLAALEPKLSKLVVTLAAGADVEGLEVKIDGRDVRRAAWGTAMPVDPGDHVVEAHAPGRVAFSTHVDVKSGPGSSNVTIPTLTDASPPPVVPPPAPTTSASPPPAASSAPPLESVRVDAVPPPPPSDSSNRKTIAIVVGSVGIVGLGVGTFFGVRAINKHHDSDNACTTNPCSDASRSLNVEAKTAADIATIAFAAGFVALGVGTWLFVTSSSDGAPAPATTGVRVRVTPALAPGHAGIGVNGAF